jgi:hypothetical protein
MIFCNVKGEKLQKLLWFNNLQKIEKWLKKKKKL